LAASNTHPLRKDYLTNGKSLPDSRAQSVERLAWLMDDLFKIPVLGWRFGLDALIGLVPGLGDTATTVVSFYILAAAVRARVPKITLLRMGLNTGIDYVIGLLPFVGDVADTWWKSNRKNVQLLRERATVSPDEAQAGSLSDWIFVGGIMLVLAGLAITSIVISFYILLRLLGYW
jgi:Domain of unknown function (DUF4112)